MKPRQTLLSMEAEANAREGKSGKPLHVKIFNKDDFGRANRVRI
jgi:hypothetical protein